MKHTKWPQQQKKYLTEKLIILLLSPALFQLNLVSRILKDKVQVSEISGETEAEVDKKVLEQRRSCTAGSVDISLYFSITFCICLPRKHE